MLALDVGGCVPRGDNGPYVTLYSSGARPGNCPATVSGNVSIRQFSRIEVMGATYEWTRCHCEVPGVSFGDGTWGYDTMMFSLTAFNGGKSKAYLKSSRFEIADDGGSWSIAPLEYNELSTNGTLDGIGPSIVRVIGWRG